MYLAAMGVVLIAVPGAPSMLAMGSTVAFAGFISAAAWFIPWYRLPGAVQVVIPVAVVGAIGANFLTDIPTTGLLLIMLLPVAWVALYGTRRDVVVVLDAATISLMLPTWAHASAAQYPGLDELRRTLVFLLVGGGLAWLLQTGRRHSFSDPLTGMRNRRAWDLEIAREMDRSRRSGDPLCVATLDLDHFKAFNDQKGHAAGDSHLQASGREWSGALRGYDVIARLGGEEFGVLLPLTDIDDAVVIIERLAQRTPNDETVSVGLAQWDGVESAAEVLGRADAALYAAKRAGRARIEVAGAA